MHMAHRAAQLPQWPWRESPRDVDVDVDCARQPATEEEDGERGSTAEDGERGCTAEAANEVVVEILGRLLAPSDACAASLACRRWGRLGRLQAVWRARCIAAEQAGVLVHVTAQPAHAAFRPAWGGWEQRYKQACLAVLTAAGFDLGSHEV